MPQQLHVLRCYSCKMFQVQIVKKVPKWQCKICNEKQMTQVIYFRGAGAECRKYVQAQNVESVNGEELAVIDGWGLDCEAEEESSDPCDCSERQSVAEKLSSLLTSDDFECKENSSLSQNSPKRQKLNCGGKQTRSLPSKLLRCTEQWSFKPHSFPATDKKMQLPNKYDKFLEPKTISKVPEEGTASNYSPTGGSPLFLDLEHKTRPDGDANSSSSPSGSRGPGSSLETHANDFQGDLELGNKKTEAFAELISSQVDESSNSSRSPFRNVATNLFDDLDDDLDFELDF